MHPSILERLASLPGLGDLPPGELAWLAEHGEMRTFDPGVIVAPGEVVEHLWIMFSGRVAVRVDRGVGLRRAMEWHPGDVTGRLPFSRMGPTRNNVIADIRTEALQIHQDHFPELIQDCPTFTAAAIHTMIDRARQFNTSALQDEKMISLGRVASGLAHELNNPASAAMRGAKLLRSALSDAERASRELVRAGLTEESIEAVEALWSRWLEVPSPTPAFDLEDELAAWMRSHGIEEAHAAALADMSATPERLDELARLVPAEALDAVLAWIAVGSETRVTSLDVENAVSRIHDLVAAVKRFTLMDKVAGPAEMHVADGLRDTIRIVGPGVDAKHASITLEVDPATPPVRAVANDLNQVWMKLIENAVYAIGESGAIEVSVSREHDSVVVRVADDGVGIEAAELPRIFDPFYTTKPPGDGMGLGLEIARQLLRRYGGEVAATSEPGRTEFEVRLPSAGAA